MKIKRLCFILCMLLLSGCTGSQFKFNKEEVSSIEFITGELHYEIKKEKIPMLVDAFNQMEIDEQEEVHNYQSSWSIIVHEQDDVVYWLNKDGSIIKQVGKQLTCLKPKDSIIKDIYTEALGKFIFIGEIRLSDEWISQTDEDHHIFQFDINSIQHVLLFGDEFYVLHPEKAEKLLTILNQTTYTAKEEQDWLSTRYPLVVYDDDSFYKIGYAYDEQNQFFYLISFPDDEDTKWYIYALEDSHLVQLWKEIFGDAIFANDEVIMDITDKPWLEKAEENEKVVSDLCERYTFDFCK